MTERPLSRNEAAHPSQPETTERGPESERPVSQETGKGGLKDDEEVSMEFGLPMLQAGSERADSGLEDVIAMVQAMRAEGFSVKPEGKKEVRSEKEEEIMEAMQVPTTMYPSTAQMDALDKLEGNTSRKFDVISPLEEIKQQYGYQKRDDMPHNRQYYHREQIPPHHDGVDEYPPQLEQIPVSRPESVTGSLFEDFDGVHYSPDDQHGVPTPPSHPMSPPYQQPNHQPDSSSHFPPKSKSPLPPGVVYYPARVPAIINLPPLLSKSRNNNNASAQRQDRRTVLYQGPGTATLPDSASATTLDLTSHRRSVADVSSKRLSALPASLRASAFFESMAPPSVAALPKVDTQQANGSAQKTLDLILDASATAPPAAFTDHPITGLPSGARTSVMHPGRASVMMMNQSRASMASPAVGRDITVTHHPGETPRSGSPVDHTHSNSDRDGDDESDEEDSDSNLDPHALPTTLLAELAQRKAQQKSRTRTAASAFPTGMHSTLLELDAVAQVQAATRRKGRPVLAWEDQPDNPAEAEDEDVPLGVLFPKGKLGGDGKGMANDEPRGLLMKKELEDSEPLAKRRERLVKEKKRFTINVPIPHVVEDSLGEEGEDAEEETLAQRRERLKRQQSQGLSTPSPSLPHDDPEDEPLAQRRLRLQAQQSPRANTPMSMPHQRQSLITTEISREQRIKDGILMVNSGQAAVGRGGMLGMGEKVPPGSRVASRAESRLESRSESRLAGRPGSGMMLQHQQQQMSGLMAQQQHYQQQQMMMLQQQQQQQQMYNMGTMGQMGQLNPMQIQMQMQMQMGMGMGYGPMNPMMQQQDPQMNQKQREFVERWRTSIM